MAEDTAIVQVRSEDWGDYGVAIVNPEAKRQPTNWAKVNFAWPGQQRESGIDNSGAVERCFGIIGLFAAT